MLSGPRGYEHLHTVLWAAGSRESGCQLRCDLHGAEVPPTAFIGMISKATVAAAFRTSDARADVFQANFDSTILGPQVNRL